MTNTKHIPEKDEYHCFETIHAAPHCEHCSFYQKPEQTRESWEDEFENKWEEDWEQFWKPLLLTKGQWDEKKIKNELHDLAFIFEQIGEVYMYITAGKLSKPMYYASVIKQEFDQALMDSVNEEVSSYQASLREKIEGMIAKENKFLVEFKGKEVEKHKWHNAKKIALLDVLALFKQEE